ncbi:MAG: TIM barrel protein [Bacteroidia bacterium]|nr:TIM barrel protein [Bacteroidia bacterium]
MSNSPMNRRQFIAGTTAFVALAPLLRAGSLLTGTRMGVAHAAYAIRWKSEIPSARYPGFSDTLSMAQHCGKIGAGGVQFGTGGWKEGDAEKMKTICEKYDMYFEGQVQLPQSDSDVERFEKNLKNAAAAGATLVRTACLSGRRYENFETGEAFQTFKANAIQSIRRAESVIRKNRIRLAIENHKDWRADELVTILKEFDSEWIGVNLDFGNNISLLEDPMEVVKTLAPYSFTTHIKDMGVEEYEEGFLLSEVPLGQGILDLRQMIDICLKHRPDITFNLEMITRDPLKIPCLTDKYWATFEDVSGKDMARTLGMVKKLKIKKALPLIENQKPEKQLAVEEENILSSFTYSRQTPGLY